MRRLFFRRVLVRSKLFWRCFELPSQKEIELAYAEKLLSSIHSCLRGVEFQRFSPAVNEAACVLEECEVFVRADVDRLKREVGE